MDDRFNGVKSDWVIWPLSDRDYARILELSERMERVLIACNKAEFEIRASEQCCGKSAFIRLAVHTAYYISLTLYKHGSACKDYFIEDCSHRHLSKPDPSRLIGNRVTVNVDFFSGELKIIYERENDEKEKFGPRIKTIGPHLDELPGHPEFIEFFGRRPSTVAASLQEMAV